MIAVGVDVGAATAKTVVLVDGRVAGYAIIPTGHNVATAADRVTGEALERAGISRPLGELDYVVSTGYGRKAVTFASKSATEIMCHAKGAHFMIPGTRTIVDIGGQDSKAIVVDEHGAVRDFVMNDKCAAGTGRFLEVMAGVLEAGSVDNMGSLSLKGESPCRISSTCTIFAESEVVSLRAEGRSREDLIAGVHRAVASRVGVMAKRLKIKPELVFAWGVAKNIGMKKALEQEFGIDIVVPEEPQILGALGAALMAAEAV
jgi:predicted CoA-substrate-specific enzyme activase